MTSRTVIIACVLLGATACSAKKPGGLQGGEPDGGAEIVVEAPKLDAVPSATPLETVALRGTTTGSRIIVQGGAEATVVSPVLPSDAFCVDVPIDETTEALRVFAAEGGALSEPVDVLVRKDPDAQTPFDATCGGSSGQCEEAEVCGDSIDNDCNGWEDRCDLACSGCEDDAFEPNDVAVTVPELAAGTYELKVCPCRDDWFAFNRAMGESIVVSASFDHDTANINMRLFYAGNGQDGEGDYLLGSFSATDSESIDYTVETGGLHFLRIYPFGDEKNDAPYSLTVE